MECKHYQPYRPYRIMYLTRRFEELKKNTKMFFILVIKMKSLSTNRLEQVKKIIKKYTTIGL